MAAHNFKVDVHTHPVPDFYREALIAAGNQANNTSDLFVDGFRTPDFDIATYLKERVDHGYNFSVLSITAPGVSFLNGNVRARELARKLNDQMSEYVKAHPNQLGAFGILPLPNVEAAIEEIGYCLDVLKFEGIGLYTNYDGVYLGEESLDPVMEELNRRNATVFVHPTAPPTAPALYQMSQPVIEYTFDTTRAIGNMLFRQARKRFPTLKVIFSHGGGALPFLADRLALQTTFPFQGGRDFNESLEDLKSFYYDTAVVTSNAQLAALKEFVGADKMVTGSDYPYLPYGMVPFAQRALPLYEGFTDEDREKIGWRNAFELFPSLKKRFPDLCT